MKRKEKYISEKKNRKGETYYQVSVKHQGKYINGGVFYVKDYGTPSVALQAAVLTRNKILAEIQNASYEPKTMPTVREIIEQQYTILQRSASTRKRHEFTWKNLLSDKILDTPIDKITKADIQISLNKYAEEHTADAVRKAVTVWRQIYEVADMLELDIPNKSKNISKPKSKIPVKHRAKEITADTLTAFIEGLRLYNYFDEKARITNEDTEYAIWIMLYTGCRPQEAFALTADDIDLRRRRIYIRHSIGSTSESRRKLITTKTYEAERTIFISDELLPILEEMLSERLKTASSEVLLVDPRDGMPYDTTWLADRNNRIAKKAGVTFNMYMLRHKFSADLFSQGVNPKVIQSLMGHKTENMSLYYAYTTEEEKADALNNRFKKE